MRYIHGGTLKRSVPGGAVVRVVFGFVILFFSLLLFADTTEDATAVLLVSSIFIWPGSFLLLFFGFRSISESSKQIPRHDLSVMLPMDINNPFFTVRCERCGLVFDYQYSDLGFRAWYREGFVECPRCQQPIRHKASDNVFQAEEYRYS